ncbi:type II toxin-antitoxin system PemK/MazF family toxin [Demequina sp. B12]|uniref:type II toxin-antitoxin system PemK/MazF family toxin n=1 Tax=Demequina sp. B12 TaxID=2992757 RepID=UPI00237A6E89|nr:type II toxin-antitoxin system PemK/MazF family toxin [Demequina sp. B12]MDE0572838.1 type II toxin-antitoxin system PemK/MazF family toxin [Demequina sp. B12]
MEALLAVLAVIAIAGFTLVNRSQTGARKKPSSRPPRGSSRSTGPRTRGHDVRSPGRRNGHSGQRSGGRGVATAQPRPYPGDYTGYVTVHYDPHPDGRPDPGEIVWTWVPFEEDHSQGKDRPVLLIGYAGEWLVGLQLTSKDHDLDAAQEARWGRYWLDIGSGPWDRKRRPSEVRLDRLIRVDPAAVRREGAILDKERFEAVQHSLNEVHHW